MSKSAEDDEYLRWSAKSKLERKEALLYQANRRITELALERRELLRTQTEGSEEEHFQKLVRIDLESLEILDQVIRLRKEIAQEEFSQKVDQHVTKTHVRQTYQPPRRNKRFGSTMKVGLFILAGAGFVAYVFAVASGI